LFDGGMTHRFRQHASMFRDPSGNNIRLTQVLEFDPARGTAP
jgi:hypothetical protein